ncbi:DUF302 domain-containing protein [Cohaesibacter celericrescens]|uniref:DUF302 domain-containing protein n=1 Tax=Cohaesibacter celericrescens TaxID=2067669 RepID=A0A2N5XJZ6_9HYPH|nr:DUF302 domain-containing protein [Cohaesibacter celericrescens]PLW74822.1 hypothetical protein C0081_21095 [Cohaesibacter celericrescens]
MSYTFDKFLPDVTPEEAEVRVRDALASRGFGVLTEIDVKATLKKKLDVDVDPYKILGACKPELAHQAMTVEPKIGVMLPCNVILRQVDGGIEVSAVEPLASMGAVDNPQLMEIASQVQDLLSSVIADL